jgi:hypothetical protein
MTKRLTRDQRIHARIAILNYLTEIDGRPAGEAYKIVVSLTPSELRDRSTLYRGDPRYQALLKPEYRTTPPPADSDDYNGDEYGDREERDIHQDNLRPAI